MSYIDVTAAILIKDEKYLIAQRKSESHQANKWEFPGGKVEPDETPKECLKRELREEFGIEATIGQFLGESCFDYGDKKIRLLGYFVEFFEGDLQLNAHQAICWINREEFDKFDFAAADHGLIEKLLS